MKKIILKVKLKNREAFEDKLSDSDLDFSAIYWQHDRVYVPRGYRPGNNFPRLIMRTTMYAVDEAPEYTLILRRHIEDSGIDIIEETPVADYSATASIILQLGFTPQKEVSRRRQTMDTEEGTIHLDQLDNGDAYAKVETEIKSTDSVTAIKSRLEANLVALGETDFIARPYAEL